MAHKSVSSSPVCFNIFRQFEHTPKQSIEQLIISHPVHGGKANNHLPAAVGLVETLCTKFSQKQLVTTVSRKRKLCETVFPQIYNTKGKD